MRKKGRNLINSYQLRDVGGSIARLVISVSKTAGTPIHQDCSSPSVINNQMNEKITPRHIALDQLSFAFTNFIRQRLTQRTSLFCNCSNYLFIIGKNGEILKFYKNLFAVNETDLAPIVQLLKTDLRYVLRSLFSLLGDLFSLGYNR